MYGSFFHIFEIKKMKQIEIELPAFGRGFHLITKIIINRLGELPQTGLLNIFLQHTSAGLAINENADLDVREDFESFFNQWVSEDCICYKHDCEGADDMPAHIKSSLMGQSLTIPIVKGKLGLGTWQGIYLCEFRNRAFNRKLIVTIYA